MAPRSGSAASSTSSFGLTHAPSHKHTDAVQVRGQYRQCHRVCKPIGTVGAHPVETAMLKVVDGRLDRRVLAPGLGKGGCVLALALGHREPTLARQCIDVEHCVEWRPVAGAVEPTVKTAYPQVAMQGLRLVDDRHRNIGIAPFPQNLV